MLKNMVTSCAAWMRVGMPLKSLKLVVYISKASEMDNDENAALIKSFSKLKDSLHVSEPLPKVRYSMFSISLAMIKLLVIHSILDFNSELRCTPNLRRRRQGGCNEILDRNDRRHA